MALKAGTYIQLRDSTGKVFAVPCWEQCGHVIPVRFFGGRFEPRDLAVEMVRDPLSGLRASYVKEAAA